MYIFSLLSTKKQGNFIKNKNYRKLSKILILPMLPPCRDVERGNRMVTEW